jgi:hypothetical protein
LLAVVHTLDSPKATPPEVVPVKDKVSMFHCDQVDLVATFCAMAEQPKRIKVKIKRFFTCFVFKD